MSDTNMQHLSEAIGSKRLDSILDELPTIVGPVSSIEVIDDGIVHHILHVIASGKSYFVKIRGDSFAGASYIKTRPEDIDVEARAIELFSKILPQFIPEIVHYNEKLKYLLLTDVMPGQINLERKYQKQLVTSSNLKELGIAVSTLHRETEKITLRIRGENEEKFAEQEIDYRVKQAGSPFFAAVAKEHNAKANRLIMGDISPKNIFIQGRDVRFCDLETVRLGAVQFDQAWLIAHILLHANSQSEAEDSFMAVAGGYTAGYQLDIADPFLLGTLEAVLVHRLQASYIPYPLRFKKDHRLRIARRIIENAGVDMSIEKMVAYLFKS